jgi:hypothetical protein
MRPDPDRTFTACVVLGCLACAAFFILLSPLTNQV